MYLLLLSSVHGHHLKVTLFIPCINDRGFQAILLVNSMQLQCRAIITRSIYYYITLKNRTMSQCFDPIYFLVDSTILP